MSTRFERLSLLALVDFVAALPLNQVVRLSGLGHERLRRTCSLKWVLDRMTDVTFVEALRACRVWSDCREIKCIKSLAMRLRGKVVISKILLENHIYHSAFKKLVKQMRGKLRFHLEIPPPRNHEEYIQFKKFRSEAAYTSRRLLIALRTFRRPKIPFTYFSQNSILWTVAPVIGKNRETVFAYCYENNEHIVHYRPALLNGRHVLDVVRTVCGPADVSEAELDHARKEATEEARISDYANRVRCENSCQIWFTVWQGPAIFVM